MLIPSFIVSFMPSFKNDGQARTQIIPKSGGIASLSSHQTRGEKIRKTVFIRESAPQFTTRKREAKEEIYQLFSEKFSVFQLNTDDSMESFLEWIETSRSNLAERIDD